MPTPPQDESGRLPAGICPLPWMHFSVNTDTSLRVCCNTDHGGHIRDESGEPLHLSDIASLSDAINRPSIKQLRQQMMKGERPDFCKSCYRIEDAGGTSVRQFYLRSFGNELKAQLRETLDDGTAAGRISYIDMSLSNNCNLKCRMCNPYASYALKNDFDACNLPYFQGGAERANAGWKDEERLLRIFTESLETTNEILTTGGEPFLSKLHIKILESAVQSGASQHIVLRYHTNLTLVPPRLVELWASFKAIEVHASIEAFGELNEYIRYPSSWETTRRNFEKLIELKGRLPLWIEVHTCFQAYGLLNIPELLAFLRNYQAVVPAMPYFIGLSNPAHLAAEVLPLELQNLARHQTWNYIDTHYRSLCSGPFGEFNREKIDILLGHFSALKEQSPHWDEFIRYTNAIDRLRGQSIERLISQIQPFWPKA